jgi:hypothetical protein
MRTILLVAGTAGLIGIFTACGDDNRPKVIGETPANQGGKGGKGGSKPGPDANEAGLGGAGNEASSLAPVVKVTSPVAVADPNDGPILSSTKATATCEVRASSEVGAGKVNTAKIRLFLESDEGELLAEKPGLATEIPDEYAAEFVFTDVPAGRIHVGCAATDDKSRTGTDEVATFLDKGPTITFESPAADSAHPLTTQLDVRFRVEPAPLTEADEGAAVTSVKLDMGGREISLEDAEVSGQPGTYALQVKLNDLSLFNPAPNGAFPLTVVATNSRQPSAVAGTLEQSIDVDGDGPQIELVSPKDKAVVGGKVRLSFKAIDPIAGVDPDTLIVSLNKVEHVFDEDDEQWSRNGTTYTFEFDSRNVEDSVVQISVNILAKDTVGNVSPAASALLYLDNYPPMIDMDPFNIRTTSDLRKPASERKCSISFDPVGTDAINDLDQVELGALFRAVIIDQTNTHPEFPVAHYSGVAAGSVRVYLEPDPENVALLIDRDEDGVCDEVAQVDSDTSQELVPIKEHGAVKTGKDDATAPASAALGCVTSEAQSTPPNHLCSNDSAMWHAIDYSDNGDVPAIYARGVSSGVECTGIPWELGNEAVKDGWVCVATRAVDVVGNVGISRPLRVCLDSKEAGTPPCANSSVDAPSCTAGCTVPERWGNLLFEDL